MNKDLIVDIFPIKSEYTNKNNEIEERAQNIILISEKDMIQYLKDKKGAQLGIDCTFKIIPRVFKPYKLMTIYSVNNENNNIILACLLCIKYTDSESLKKIFSVLNINYDFAPITVTCDFDAAQIKALKECTNLKKKPYIITCLFHFTQTIIRKFKKYNIIKKSMNKHSYELLRNLELLCFVNPQKVKNYNIIIFQSFKS